MASEPVHLSDQDVDRYRGHRMPRAELLASDDHLATCDDCRTRLWSGAQAGEALNSIEAALANTPDIKTEHLTYEEMAWLVDDQMSEPDREVFNTHLTYCTQCAEEVADLLRDKSIIDAGRGKGHTPNRGILAARSAGLPRKLADLWRVNGVRWAIQAAAAAVIILIVTWAINLRFERQIAGLQSRIAELERNNEALEKQASGSQDLQNELAEARRENEALQQELANTGQPLASLNDGGGRIELAKNGHLTGLDFLNPSYQEDVRAALAARRVKIPAEVAALRGGSGTLMGEPGEKGSYRLIAPVGTVVRSNRPAFHWRGVAGAGNYEVTIYGDGFKEVAASGPLSETTWTPKAPLQRGQVYTWQVVTVVDGKRVVLPPAAAPRAKFRVLEEPALAELERVERAHDRSHLALGVIYARNGLLEESRREFQALVAVNPGSEAAKKLLRSVTGGQ